MITKITKAYTRHYSDNNQTTTYVEWIDNKGREGRTEGTITPRGHMEALVMRAAREGVKLEQQIW